MEAKESKTVGKGTERRRRFNQWMSESAEQKSKEAKKTKAEEEEGVEEEEVEKVFGLCRWYYHPNSSSNGQYCTRGQAEAIIGLHTQFHRVRALSLSLLALYIDMVDSSRCAAVRNQSDYR